MSSITTAVAVDYRLQQWAQLVKDCQNHPQDMTVEYEFYYYSSCC